MKFKDKVIVITGATGGIGSALAERLAQEECKLALFARREKNLKDITKKISSTKTPCIYKPCDVTNKQEAQEAVDYAYTEFGRIDVAILTAGVLIPNPIETLDSTIIKKSMDINFLGTVYVIEHLLPIMKKQRSGTIAAVSTLPDRRGVPGWGAYGASKAAVSWFMESLRAEAKQKYNINIITIKPGSVQTPMIDTYPRVGAISPGKAAAIIVNGIKNNKKIIQFPFLQVFVTRTTDLFPVVVYDHLPIDMLKGEGYPEVEDK